MSDYTPTTAEVKHLFARAMQTELSSRYAEAEAEFDRWLAVRDREVAASANRPEFACGFCNYPFPAGEGDPRSNKYAKCTICGNEDEWGSFW